VTISSLLTEVLKENALSEEIVDFNNSHKIGVPQIYADIESIVAKKSLFSYDVFLDFMTLE